MALTKAQIIQMLTEAGATFDENDTVPNLKKILAEATADGDDAVDTAKVDPLAGKNLNAPMPDTSAPKPNADTSRAKLNLPTSYDDIANMPEDTLEARFEKFLARARHQRTDKSVFDTQKAAGEFDTIPKTFADADAAQQAAK